MLRMLFGWMLVIAGTTALAGEGPVSPEPVDGEEPTLPQAPGEPDFDDPDQLSTFVDAVVRTRMDRDNIAGVTVAVVHEGETVLLRGYGQAYENGTPVDLEKHLFRVASISKTFIWTAIMQLVEQGKISLDDPINEHLPESLHVEERGEDIVRIRHLLAHNAGFEDSMLGHLIEIDQDELRPLNQYLAEHQPERVREAGELITYSNYASALAGALVAEVAGIDFETYVEDFIFAPLGMERSSFREPLDEAAVERGLPEALDEALAADISEGFQRSGGKYRDQGFEYLAHTSPSGGMSATAADMARFMLAHLNKGELDGERILEAETAREMHTLLASNAEGVDGMVHGFIERSLPGDFDAFGHGGALFHFFSEMILIPDLELGVFISTNTRGGRSMTRALPNLLVDHFFVEPGESPEPPEDFADTGERYAGEYRGTRRNYTTVEKLASLDSVTTVRLDDEGYLVTDDRPGDRRWMKIDEQLFVEVDGPDTLGFRESEDGEIDRMYLPGGTQAADRIGYFASQAWLSLIGGLTALAAVGGLAWSWRGRRLLPDGASSGERHAGWLLPLQSLLWLGGLALFSTEMDRLDSGLAAFANYPSALAMIAVATINLAALTTLANAVTGWWLWRERRRPLSWRLAHAAGVLTAVALMATLCYWNVIGWRF